MVDGISFIRFDDNNFVENGYHILENNSTETEISGPQQNHSKRKKFIFKLITVFFYFIFVAILLTLLIFSNGEITIFCCRIIATIGAVFMLISIIRMANVSMNLQNLSPNSQKSMPLMIGFILAFMTLFSLYGYFIHISKIFVFWNFDFILHYQNQIIELLMDCFYIPCIILYLIALFLFMNFVAPFYETLTADKWIFGTTLFVNALQIWLFESTVAHMEMCEQFNQINATLCSKYIHYQTSFENLTNAQSGYYLSIKDQESFTYTVTMKLFMAYIGLILYFAHHDKHKQETLPKIQNQIKPSTWLAKAYVTILFFILFISLFYIIVFSPIISTTFSSNIWLIDSRIYVRLLTHLSNFALLWYLSCCLFQIQLKPKWPFHADIIILWVAWILNALKAFTKFIVHFDYFWPNSSDHEKTSLILSQFGNFFESLSLYFLILLVQFLLLIAEKSGEENTRNYLSKFILTFLPLYFCISMLSFAAYYNLNNLYFLPETVDSVFGVNLIVFLQSTCPTTMLFSMTVCLCFASIMEKLFKNGYYRVYEKTIINSIVDMHRRSEN